MFPTLSLVAFVIGLSLSFLFGGFFLMCLAGTYVVPYGTEIYLSNLLIPTARLKVLKPGINVSPFNVFYTPVYITLNGVRTMQIPTRMFEDRIENYLVVTSQKVAISISGSTNLYIIDPLKAICTISDFDNYVDKVCKSQIRNMFSNKTLEEILQNQSAIQAKLLDSIRENLEPFGVKIDSFVLVKVVVPEHITTATAMQTAKQLDYATRLLEIENKKRVTEVELEIEQMRDNCLLGKFHHYKAVDPNFSINTYLYQQTKAKAYANNPRIVVHDYKPSSIQLDPKRADLI